LTESFSAVISGLDENDYIDLKDLTFTSAADMQAHTSYLDGNTTLQITKLSTSQSITFTLAGNYSSSTWIFDNDGAGGTIFHDPPAASAGATTISNSTSTDLAPTVTAALTTQDADQFTFEDDSQSGTPAEGSTLVASTDPSAADASDTSQSSPDDAAATALADANAATSTEPATADATQPDATTQTACAPAAGLAADTFVFAANFGNVTIGNFDPGTDVIEIDHTVFADFEALLAAAHDDGSGNAVITADPNDTITIKNVTVAQLVQHQSDFHFT
jgi:hypothetical protein